MPTEKADTPKGRTFLQVLFDRWWKKVIAGIIAFTILALILIPYGIRYSAKRMILAKGGDEANIEDVDFNPFTGRLALKGVNIKVGREQYLRIGDAEALVRWLPLLKRRIGIKRVWLNNTEMTIESLPGGEYRLGGITAALLKGSQKEHQEEESSPWGYGAQEVTIENTKVHLRMPELETTVHVNKWTIRRAFSWQPSETANVDIDCEINGSPLQISGRVTPFAKAPRVTAKLKLDRLKTDPFNGLLRDSGISISGAVSLDTDLELNQKEDGSFTLAHDGIFLLENLGLKTSDLGASAANIKYDGKLNASLPSSSDLPLEVNSDGQLTAIGLDVAVGEDEFKEEKLGWKGIIAATVLSSAKKVQAVLDGRLDSQKSTAILAGANLNVEQRGFNWKGKVQAQQASDDTGISLDGTLAIIGVQAQSETLKVLQEALNWKGRLDVNLPKGAAGLSLKSNGRLEGGKLDFKLPGEKLSSRHDAIGWEGDIGYTVNEKGPRVDLDGSLNLDELAFDSADAVVAERRIDWSGKGVIDLPHENEKLALQLDGKIILGPLKARLPANHLEINQESFSWNGLLAYGKGERSGEPASGAAARIGNLRVTDDNNRHLLLGADDISVEDFRLIGEKGLSGKTLQINSLQLLGSRQAKAEPLLGAKSITLQSFEVDPENKIEIDAIVIDTLQSILKRKSDGQWSFSERLAALQPSAGEGSERPKADKTGPQTASPRYRLGKLVIRGNSQIEFDDLTVEPAVSTTMTLNSFELGNLDSARPGEESPLKLEGKIGKYTEINFEGTVKPFDERLSMDLKGGVADLELPPYSPYIVKAIGYKFASGQVDANLEMAIKRGNMDGLARFQFNELRAKAVDAETLKKQGVKQTIPMETALSLLRDKDGTIKLDVPITGDIADPKFSFADAINQAVVKATATASMAYLKYALGPYGLAIAAAEVAYKAATQAGGIRLEPVKFTAGTADIDPSDQGYIKKLATILKDRPDAKIRVCGLAAQSADQAAILARASAAKPESAAESSPSVEANPPADKAKEESGASTATAAGSAVVQLPPEQLEELAKSRSMAIKDLLVGQYGIKDDRILLCHPEIDKTSAGKPRAEILF
jgi:outer membrane protein OmpA-like peptidoglycan-associated protein